MLTKTAIYIKYSSLDEYDDFIDQTCKKLQQIFPQVKVTSFSKFKNFLDKLLPKLVHKYLIGSGTMKNCSGISPDFAEIGCQAGFAVLTQHIPGHQRNIVLTTEGPFIVDLSYIQFTCKHDLSDKKYINEVVKNYKELYKDPWKAVKIEQLPNQPISGISLPQGIYSNVSPDPMKIINDYSMEEAEEVFPEKFLRFKRSFK